MENKKSNVKKQTFMAGVLTIVIAQILIKVLGFIYRFVITNIPGFGDAGNGYYGAGYQIYTLLIAISSMGIPGAISKLISERIALNDHKGAHRIFKVAIILFAIVGSIGSLMLFCGAKFISNVIIDNPGAEYTLVCLSPSIFFVCISAVIRGYFNGMQDMKATATSQTLEQIFNCVFTITIVYMLTGNNAQIMAAGSSIATTLATMISFIYLGIFYNKRKKNIWKNIRDNQDEKQSEVAKKTFKSIVKTILALSIPISLGSIISAINRTVDTMTVMRGLKTALGYNDELANYWYGILSGKVDMLTNFPLALNIGLSVALVPAISAAMAKGDKETASKRVSFSLMITMLFILPCTVGIITLADPILRLLFPAAPEGALLLQISTIAVIFTSLSQTINGSLQGLGKVFVPAISLICGCIIKIILNLLLIYNPAINIYGAAIGSVACHVVSSNISFAVLRKNMKLNLKLSKFIIKPVIANIIMSIIAILSYKILVVSLGNSIATICAILIAVIVYFVAVILLKILDKEDFYMIPGGTNIIKILQKIKIY